LILAILGNTASFADLGEKSFGIERQFVLDRYGISSFIECGTCRREASPEVPILPWGGTKEGKESSAAARSRSTKRVVADRDPHRV